MDFSTALAKRAQLVEQALDLYLPPVDQYPGVIHEAMRYSVFAGGKRLRPVLVLAGAEAVGGELEAVMPAACAMELLHTYSLIHDDLPAMDNDDLRRGKPTSHKVFGEALAILAGDALLTLAFALLARLPDAGPTSPDQVVRVLQEVAEAAGTVGLIGGQVADLHGVERPIDQQTLDYIHTHKTGSLFRVAVRAGAILSGASPEQVDALTLYATNMGLAFQIIDDILDVEGDEQKLGKPVGSDLRNQKATYPALFGMAEAREKARLAGDQALDAIIPLGPKAHFLQELMHFILTRQY